VTSKGDPEVVARAASGASGPAPTWVLLEGASDVAAVRALRAVRGVLPDDEPCRLVDMGGATNIRRHLAAAAATRPRPRVVGLCDEREAGFVVRALEATAPRRAGAPRHGGSVDTDTELNTTITVDDLPAHGFQVCRGDLEDELLRALGVENAQRVLADVWLADAFIAFARQPAWLGRPAHDQLHRFCGTTSGRKELLAGALAGALDEASWPPPLAALLASMPLR
jgi:hypothetical protein